MNEPSTECYGKLFPDLLNLQTNRENRGQVFSAVLQSIGVGAQARKVSVNMAAWAKCLACPDYRACYDLSLGKLMLQEALASRG